MLYYQSVPVSVLGGQVKVGGKAVWEGEEGSSCRAAKQRSLNGGIQCIQTLLTPTKRKDLPPQIPRFCVSIAHQSRGVTGTPEFQSFVCHWHGCRPSLALHFSDPQLLQL